MRILLWHVHGSWTTAFVQGPHIYLVPVDDARGPDGLGRAQTWDWPASVVEITRAEARQADVDLVVLQRPHELEHLVADWLGRRPGVDVPAVYLEHNAPDGPVDAMVHPVAERTDIPVVHVTYFNDLFWDGGKAPHLVIEHGVVDPGYRFTGARAAAVMVVNDPVRRNRVVGADLLAGLRQRVPVDLFGMRSESLGGLDVPQSELHDRMAERRVYVHPVRWTSLGLSLIEAMHLGLPVVALGTTEVADAVPAGAGVVSNRPAVLADALESFVGDPELAAATGRVARRAALDRYGLARFLADWDRLLAEVAR